MKYGDVLHDTNDEEIVMLLAPRRERSASGIWNVVILNHVASGGEVGDVEPRYMEYENWVKLDAAE